MVWRAKEGSDGNLILREHFCLALLSYRLICGVILQLDNGVSGLFESFSRLDSRISGVGQTAARIGDHLQVSLFLLFSCSQDQFLFSW